MKGKINMKKLLECQDLCKSFGKKQILKNVSFELDESDILAFIGPNGSGKTTTIKLILGLQGIDKGSVNINGYDIKKDFVKAIEKVGAIVENPDTYMYLSGWDNLKLTANMYKNISDEAIKDIVKLVDLETRIHDKVSKYSLGMRQRLGIARALINKPNILILDEPTNGLDPEGIKELRELLVKLASDENMAILISSHNLAELDSFCNKVCIIKNGIIIETSDIEAVKSECAGSYYIFEVDNNKRAQQFLGESATLLHKNEVRVLVEKDNVPYLIKELVMQDIKIYSVRKENISLEDAFLKKTGGNIID